MLRELEGRPWVIAAQSWAETLRGFVGKCIGWTEAQLPAKGISRPANPIDFEAPTAAEQQEWMNATVLDGCD